MTEIAARLSLWVTPRQKTASGFYEFRGHGKAGRKLPRHKQRDGMKLAEAFALVVGELHRSVEIALGRGNAKLQINPVRVVDPADEPEGPRGVADCGHLAQSDPVPSARGCSDLNNGRS
jgi:hypothetical protein